MELIKAVILMCQLHGVDPDYSLSAIQKAQEKCVAKYAHCFTNTNSYSSVKCFKEQLKEK